MGILNSIKTRKVNEELEIFEKVGKYEIYEPSNEIWSEITELFSQADQDKIEDGQYVSTFGKDATIQLFRLLTNIDMTEKVYDTYATKRNVRLMLVQQYVIEVVQTYLKLGMTTIENEKLSEELGVDKPKNRNDKTVILDQWKEKETERNTPKIIGGEIKNGNIVLAGEVKQPEIAPIHNIDDEIADLERKIKEKKRADLFKQLAELGE